MAVKYSKGPELVITFSIPRPSYIKMPEMEFWYANT
jgi:hypothetical protein